MIVTISAHGRDRKATRDLLAHLLKTDDGQVVETVRIAGTCAPTPEAAMGDFETLRDGSAATIAFQHLTVSPGRAWTAAERDTAVSEILRALGATRHAYLLIAHHNKVRARGQASDTHYHLVVAHVGPTLRALCLRSSYAELEAARALCEIRIGEPLTPSRRNGAIVARLRRNGHEAAAAQVKAAACASSFLPRSGLTSQGRAWLARRGICAPRARAAVIAAYQASDTRPALTAALTQAGLSLEPGERDGVWVVRRNGALIGALDRLVGVPRAVVSARMLAAPQEPEQAALPGHSGSGPPTIPPGPALGPSSSEGRSCTGVPDAGAGPAGSGGHAAIPQAEPQDRMTASDQALEAWKYRIACGLAVEEAALEQARRRSSSPPSRTDERDLARAVCRRAAVACRAAQARVDELRPKVLTGLRSRVQAFLFPTQSRRDAVRLAAAERDLARADAQRAAADATLERITGEMAAAKRAYTQRLAQEDAQAEPRVREAEARIALYRDLLMLLEREPWLATQSDTVLLEGVARLRRVRNARVWDEAPVPRPG